MSTVSVRTGSAYGMTNEILQASTWNNLVKSLDQGLLRVLAGTLLSQGLIINSSGEPEIDETNNRFTAPAGTVAGVIDGVFFYLDNTHEIDTIATGGSTTTASNSAFTYGANFWKDAYIIFTSGTNDGAVRQVTAYDSATGKVTWSTPLVAAVAAGDTYTLTFYYISGLTNNTLNYVYGQLITRSPYDNVIKFVANTTGTKPASSILLSTITLNSSGVATASDNAPAGADRSLYCNMGGYDVLTYSALVEDVPATSYTDVEVTHSFLLYRGGITVEVDDGNCTVEPIEYYKSDKTKIRISNPTGSPIDTTYTLTVSGRVREYL